MITDALTNFVPIGGNLSMVAASGVSIPSTLTYDFLGSGVGTAPHNIYGNSTVFGQADAMGIGQDRPELNITTGTAFTTSNSATLNVALQAAIDTGSGGGYLPGTWQTLVESGTLTAAQLLANTVIARFPWVPPFPANLRPRFLRLLFQIPAATAFTAGTIASALVVMVRDDYAVKFQPANFAVS